MALTLCIMLTHFEKLLNIKSFYALIRKSCKATWQTKTLYIHNQSTYGNKLGRMMIIWWGTTCKFTSSFITWSLWSHDKIKLLHISYRSVCEHQTCWNDNILWQASNHKVIQNFNHVVLEGQMANKSHYISITRVSIAAKLDRMMSFLYWPLHIMSNHSLVTWPHEIWGSLTGRGSTFKQLSSHQLLVFRLFLYLVSAFG